MERSKSQKFLRVVSIISVIGAVISLILAALMIFGGVMFGAADPSEAAEVLADTDMTQVEAGAAVSAVGIIMVFEGLFSLIQGILGLRAAKDNQKIMPVWWISVISLALDALSLVTNLFSGSLTGETATSVISSLVVSALMFWIANNIKKEAGK